MTSSWLFPPRTSEVQFDEKWSFVAKKQKNCDPTDPADDHKGDWWDHVAFDPEHRLVLAVVPGARSIENAEEVVAAAKDRTDGASPRLMTSDEYPAYASAIEAAFGEPVAEPPAGPGRRPILPERRLPDGVTYATVHKEREDDRVVAVERRLIFGTERGLEEALEASPVSRAVNTSFVERQHGTDRGRNARKARKTYRFSKDWRVHEAMSYFTLYRYNFCWVVRTLRQRDDDGRWRRRTPAMAAGLSDHIWSLRMGQLPGCSSCIGHHPFFRHRIISTNIGQNRHMRRRMVEVLACTARWKHRRGVEPDLACRAAQRVFPSQFARFSAYPLAPTRGRSQRRNESKRAPAPSTAITSATNLHDAVSVRCDESCTCMSEKALRCGVGPTYAGISQMGLNPTIVTPAAK